MPEPVTHATRTSLIVGPAGTRQYLTTCQTCRRTIGAYVTLDRAREAARAHQPNPPEPATRPAHSPRHSPSPSDTSAS